MKSVSFLFFFILINIQSTFAVESLTCNVEKFKISNVDISTEINQGIKKASANFMLHDSYWNFSIYELDKSDNFHLLKGIEDLEKAQDIYKKFFDNYSYRLKDQFIFSNRLAETNTIILSNISGLEFVLKANFKELHSDINKNEEIFILRVATNENKIYFAELHINHVKQMEVTIKKAKEIMNSFSNTCLIN
jgi:hypothetical protein